jgi:hypothetical protein
VARARPTGEADDKAYANAAKWPKKKWAWEFLRRNAEFIGLSKQVEADPQLAGQVAEQFGLKRFKSAREPYSGKSCLVPQFSAALLRWRARHSEVESAVHLRRMEVGELLLVLNLRHCLEKPAALAAQLRVAKSVAYRELVKFASLSGRSLPKQERVTSVDDWLHYLRILDALKVGKSHSEVALLVYPRQVRSSDDRLYRASFIKSRIESAKSFAEGRYLDIALADPRPIRKKTARFGT